MRNFEELEHPGKLAGEVEAAESILEQLAGVFRWNAPEPNGPGKATSPEDEPINLEARYRTLVEQIPAVVFMAYLDQGIGEAYVSPHIEALLGFTQEEWLNDPIRWYQQIHPDDKARWSVDAANMFLSGRALRSIYRVFARDGRVLWFQCEAKMVHRDDGRPWFIHGVGIDVTELKNAESELKRAHDELETRVHERTAELALANQELQIEIAERKRAEEERAGLLTREHQARTEAEAANRLKDEFLATVSHELRTPLTAVLGWACVLRMGRFGESSFEKALEAIERNAKSQSQLIDDLLDVSRIVAGKLRLKIQAVDLGAVIESALDSIRPAAEAKEIVITTSLKSLQRTLSADPDRLQQIIWNILSNAVKFTPRQGRVHIQVEPHEEEVRIVVSDNGPGITREFLPHVFERFRQADGSFTRAHGGLGLGLAIARHLAELHGGTIEASSDLEIGGSIFTVKLPLQQNGSSSARELPPPVMTDVHESLATRPLAGLRVLVVDDDADALELLALIFSQYGAEVQAVSSARDALDTYLREPFDVLVSDIQMPDEDGYQLMRKIKVIAEERGTRLTALAVTAHAKAEDRVRALQAGYHAHVPKPIDPMQLVFMLASLVTDGYSNPA
jgi:PAS domain S-box-containing protein